MSSTTKEEKNSTQPESDYIVGIGASAGGLEALQMLLEALPTDLGFPYILIQHLSPDYKSLLSEILSKHTKMPVIQAEDAMIIKPDCIYVIPPRKSLTIKDGKLCLIEQITGALHLPIDAFFDSLAEEAAANAIAIVLSGTGSDGTNGIKNIKERDGMVIVQSPESSKFDGMPKSALRTGLVDFQGTPEEIATEIEHVAYVAKNGTLQAKTAAEIDAALMERIYYILKRVSNVNFTHYKKATILRRVERRMLLAHKDSLSDYVDYLYAFPDEAKTLSKEVLIGVTNFFREREYFDLLQDKAIKDIVTRSQEGDEIRVWVAGCSTGEEAYSIAILFCEVMESMKIKREVKIFATDLDSEAISTAGKGVFGSNITASVSAARLSKFFTRKNDTYIINRDVRKMLVFSPHNVVQDPPFARLDLVSCRNLLIYFEPVLQKDLFAIFHAALKEGGYLFLGKSEAVGGYTDVFPVVDAAAKIFSHRSNVKIKGAKPVPYLQNIIDDYESEEIFEGRRQGEKEGYENDEQTAINTALLEKFMPACVVVNEKNDLVYVYGDCKNYISFPVGRVSNALFDIIAESLRIPVSTALKESREKQKLIQYTDIRFSGQHSENVINLTATPINTVLNRTDALYALIFSETNNREISLDALPYDIDHMAAQRITDLEQELINLQDKLGRSVSEQEVANEELQASNEELLTANEELQSSNEELQSVNEELYTVNSEYQTKVTELAEMNDDITNFLATTLIGIVFVDSKLSLRRFTNYITTEFNIMEQDIGRPIDFVSYQFPNVDLAAMCNEVIGTLLPEEREVDTNRGKTFFMRIAPFRTIENKILGCVLTFVDLTAQKQERIKLQATEAQLTIAQRNSAAKSDFLSRMSHEIRTPMNALVGLSEILQTQYDDKDALMSSAHQIASTVKYMTSIISDVLEMSKIERSQVELISVPFSMKDVLNRVTSMVEPRMMEAGIDFDVSISDKFSPIYIGDATRIQQLIINFLSNAEKFTPRGGEVKFSASEISVSNGVATICFVVSDNGIGISKKFLPDLFKPFTRESHDEKSSTSSMGLGLSIAHSLIELMDGNVKVETQQGKGSTFTICIKVIVADKNDYPQEVILEPLSDFTGCNVLLAEDNSMNRKVLEALLANKNVTFKSAKDGEEVVNIYNESPDECFDCILMDMRMPNLDGVGATAMIRSSEKPDAKTVPIIAVSADADPSEMRIAREAGITDYITKPIDTKALFILLERCWKKLQ